MLERQTTLVLGAGSSFVFGLPLGVTLKSQIASAINIHFEDFKIEPRRGSREIAAAFRELAKTDDQLKGSLNNYLRAGRDIAEALPVCSSIDDYVERHSGNAIYEQCAKLGIAHCILAGERLSKLRQDPTRAFQPDITEFQNSWLSRFLQLVTRGCQLVGWMKHSGS
jgi:hypothetical protein